MSEAARAMIENLLKTTTSLLQTTDIVDRVLLYIVCSYR